MRPLQSWARKARVRFFLPHLRADDRILEIGPGEGWFRRVVESTLPVDYLTIDLCAPADIRGDVRDWRRHGLKAGSFDAIVAFEVVEHTSCFVECHDLLKPSGRLLLTTPMPRFDWLLKVFEVLRLTQKRTSEHSHLVIVESIPGFASVQAHHLFGLVQWAVLQKIERSRGHKNSVSDNRRVWWILLAAFVVGALAVTNQSLWIDEGNTAAKAMQTSLGAWCATLVDARGSDLQMPGYMFAIWVWAKIFGHSEVALRALNAPFFVGGVMALAWGTGSSRRCQTAIVLLALSNAFLWYYLSEARPYIFLFAFGSLTAGCLLQLIEKTESALISPGWFRLFCLGVLGLCLTSLIAVPWALGAIAAVLFWSGPRAVLGSVRRFKIVSGLTILALGGLALYYLWTMQLGARASDVGRTGWSNLAFIFYELLGLGGLGPGRLDLRTHGASAMAAFLPWIALGASAILILVVAGWVVLTNRLTKRHIVFFIIAVAAPLALVLAAGVAGHMRLLGRHLTPLLPYLLAWMALGFVRLAAAPAFWKKILPAAALALFLLSALEIRFAARHQRDDYRSAAALARAAFASGEQVWWLADISTGLYYQVPLGSPQITTSPDLRQVRTPLALVILSKPDIYDSSGAVRAYLAQNGFRVTKTLPAFELLRRPPAR